MSQPEIYELLKKINGKHKLTVEQIHTILGLKTRIQAVYKSLKNLDKYCKDVHCEEVEEGSRKRRRIYWIEKVKK